MPTRSGRLDKDGFGAGANYSRRTLMTFAFLEILAKYPANTDAKAILDKCVAMERKDYTDAVASQSVASLDAFMKKYPDSAFREDVADRIDDLPLWLKAKGQNTIDSYKRYLAESEHRIYKQEADDAIADLSTSQAYFNALRVNTIDALKQFRKDYPASSYDKRASSKIARLMADKFTSESSYADKEWPWNMPLMTRQSGMWATNTPPPPGIMKHIPRFTRHRRHKVGHQMHHPAEVIGPANLAYALD